MITSQKLAIYREFKGNVDWWERTGRPKRDEIEERDWYDIEAMLQELTQLKRNLVSKEYGEQIRQKLSGMTADQETAQALLEMA